MVAAAPGGVGSVRPLRDHALEPVRRRGLEEAGAVALDVVRETDDSEPRREAREELLAPRKGQRARVAAERAEEIEGVVDDRDFDRGARDGAWLAQPQPLLDAPEGAPPRRVERHELAVDREAREREARDGAGDLGVDRRAVGAGPHEKPHAAVRVLDGKRSHAVVLELEEPTRAGEGAGGAPREGRAERGAVEHAHRSPEAAERGLDVGVPRHTVA